MKKGISLVSLVIVIIIMVILAGIVVIEGFESNENIAIDTFALELLDVQNGVDEYYYRNEKYPSGDQYILDTTKVESLEQFTDEEIIENGINFKIVDLSLIGINSTEFGSGKGKDIYVLSEKTGIVYYLEGVKFKDKTYYTLTDELYEITNANNSELVSTQDVKVYNVIFRPSATEYTNKPVTVTMKIPKIAVINSVTTTNNKSIGTETVEGLYKQIQINETSTDKTGNYKITINYTYRGTEKTSEYEVTNYDANLPQITYTETVNGDFKTVNVKINENNSKIKNIKYEQEVVSNIAYFKNYGKQVTNNKFVIEKDAYFTIYVETESGTNLMVNNLPDEWKPQIVDIVDGVPIPKGFVASGATGENKKNTGLVIYEGIDEVTDLNVDDAKRNRNQYVWIPVEDFSDFVRREYKSNVVLTDSNGKYFELGTADKYWESEMDDGNMPLLEQNIAYMTTNTLTEIQAMYASVKKYKGFYIGRYEVGLKVGDHKNSDDGELVEEIHVKMNKAPYNYIRWTYNDKINEDTNGAVSLARGIYPLTDSDYGVVSTLTYGVQWDRVLTWWLETKAQNGTKDVTINSTTELNNSTLYGNYGDNEIEIDTFNEGAMRSVGTDYRTISDKKYSGSKLLFTTGATEETRVNNIYDMAGNLWEWTMEGYSNDAHAVRGGHFNNNGNHSVVFRYHSTTAMMWARLPSGSIYKIKCEIMRIALIKKLFMLK